jgi:hypothetical protein
MGSGHFGATGFENSNREVAFLYAFYLTALGMEGGQLATIPARKATASSPARATASRSTSRLAVDTVDLL